MDASLLKSKAAFMKAASTTSAVQIRPQPEYSTYDSEQVKKKKKKKSSHKTEDTGGKALDNLEVDYSSASNAIANSANFSTMAKIVDYMKKRRLSNITNDWGLSLNEILEEIQVFDLSKKSEQWLREALPKNPRLTVVDDSKFVFKPPYPIKGKTSLIKVLVKQHQDGRGGILLSDLSECIPNPEKSLESLSSEVIVIPTQVNKRKDKVIFWNDPSTNFEVDEDFKAIWRMISIDHLDEKKIEEYLVKHGIDTMRDLAPKKNMVGPPKRKQAKRRTNVKVHNEHLDDVLEDYN
ncbi:gtf-2E2 [Pristionchus pacificus]|uniref:Transcription initiation factor IIE subunit beta n=1 Tax=Pristionchus pacificus TaxID=54126 RepID=A0A2A6BZ31_PRIPA|nr:gtf-2E2 [Pristionchus pacificus]|eukprot:PDM71138.1 hypothetical protein PRIPAC_43521 [Pristionchus pacificus]